MIIPQVLQNVLTTLNDVRQQGDGSWMARCPAHPDTNPSLHITLQNGRVLLHCFAGCSLDAICSALNIEPKDLFLREEVNHQYPKGEGLTLEAFAKVKHLEEELLRQAHVTQGAYRGKHAVVFEYRDAFGNLKAIRYRLALAGDKFAWQKGAKPKELGYGEWWLPHWREKGKRAVVLVEGETDALTLWQVGVPAIGVAGANSLSEYHAKLLKGFEVVVWQEPDTAGATFAQKASELFPHAKVIAPPAGIKDASELWLKCVVQHREQAKAVFKEQIRELLAEAKLATSTEARQNLDRSLNLTSTYREGAVEVRFGRTFSLHELKHAPVAEDSSEGSLPFFGVLGIIRRGRTHLLAGKPRVGKTEALFRGGVLEWHNERILYLSEENKEDWRVRLAAFEDEELPAQCHVMLCTGASRENLLAEIKEANYSVVVIDTLRGIWRLSDELHPSRVVQDIAPLIDLQRKLGFTLVVLHHERKAEGEAFSDRFAGTNALSGAFDMLLSLNQKGESQLVLSYEGRTSRGGSLLLQWQDGNLRYVGEAETLEWRILLQRVEAVLARAAKPLTTKEVYHEIGEPQPNIRQIQRALQYLHESGQVWREPKEDKPGATYRWYLQNLAPNLDSIPYIRRGEVGEPEPNLDSIPYIRRGEVGEVELPWWYTGKGVPEGEPEFLEVGEGEGA